MQRECAPSVCVSVIRMCVFALCVRAWCVSVCVCRLAGSLAAAADSQRRVDVERSPTAPRQAHANHPQHAHHTNNKSTGETSRVRWCGVSQLLAAGERKLCSSSVWQTQRQHTTLLVRTPTQAGHATKQQRTTHSEQGDTRKRVTTRGAEGAREQQAAAARLTLALFACFCHSTPNARTSRSYLHRAHLQLLLDLSLSSLLLESTSRSARIMSARKQFLSARQESERRQSVQQMSESSALCPELMRQAEVKFAKHHAVV